MFCENIQVREWKDTTYELVRMSAVRKTVGASQLEVLSLELDINCALTVRR